ncbi:hypothetical protein [Streptomyces cavernicola]|uniref:Uncharacterized protein n=1 Tax=Streptomyces cavernicola TaxID=3043613 RepID=A0ABT6S2R9_9ACTN|nr:hypothetical protein [Streptomyces sp. B-S-A6]MDI3402367.1 hypothetical protein [Streptomyces sp. B-S-A6]
MALSVHVSAVAAVVTLTAALLLTETANQDGTSGSPSGTGTPVTYLDRA